MNALIIANTQIRRDVDGRYSLNDLHQSSGGESKHAPDRWLRSQQAKDLVDELLMEDVQLATSGELSPKSSGNAAVAPTQVIEGRHGGTYAVKELVYAYAMWISAAFHLHVIRAYDALVTQKAAATAELPASPNGYADAVVSASRTLNALLRAGRQLGLSRAHVIAHANAGAEQATGINLVNLLDAQHLLTEPDPPPIPGMGDWPELTSVMVWLTDRKEVSITEIIDGALAGIGHNDSLLAKRIGRLMAGLGWSKYRPRSHGGRFVYRRPNVH